MATKKSPKDKNVFAGVRNMTPNNWLVIAVVLVLLAGIGWLAHQYDQTRKEAKQARMQIEQLKDPQEAARIQNEQLVADVGQLVQLPSDETPTIATVTDVSKLKDQPFFANAQNSDKVLIYAQAGKAYLYRPSANKIINIAPVNLGGEAPGP